jgi:hypothetical protein
MRLNKHARSFGRGQNPGFCVKGGDRDEGSAMPRKARVDAPGALHHIIAKGMLA